MIRHTLLSCFLNPKILQKSYSIKYFSNIQHKLKTSYSFCPGDVHLSSNTVSQVLDETADKCGDQAVFISKQQGITKTYSEFRLEVDKLASGLIFYGLKKGDRVAICSPNCYEWPLFQFASAKAGLISVNINPACQPQELEYCLKKVGCKAVIVWDILKTQNFYEILCEIIPGLSTSKSDRLSFSNFPDLERIIMISKTKERGVLRFEDVFQSGNRDSNRALGIIEKNVQFDDPVNIQFTSGTTGAPKGSILSHHNIVNNAIVAGRRMGFTQENPTICCQVPLFHCFGCVLGTLGTVLFQGTCILPHSLFNTSASLNAIEDNKCTVVYGTPTMYVDMLTRLKAQKSDVSSLKHAVMGGSPMPLMLVKEILEAFKINHITNAYGSTENSPVVAMNGREDGYQCILEGTVRAVEHVEIKLVDEENRVVPIRSQGEICVRGFNVFLGYWDDPTKTAEVVDNGRWYHTGDLAEMDENGFVKIVGRKKDMIIRGGENIFPTEIETFLSKHPSILEVHVVGLPDPRMGEEVCAWVTFRDGKNVTQEEIKEFCKGKISHFKIPRYILPVKNFPKTTSGKIQKFEMARISIDQLGLG